MPALATAVPLPLAYTVVVLVTVLAGTVEVNDVVTVLAGCVDVTEIVWFCVWVV